MDEVERLIQQLYISDKNTVWRATDALIKIGDARAIPAFMELMNYKDPAIGLLACHALAAFGEAALPDLITALKDPVSKYRAAGALKWMSCTVIPALIEEALKDENAHVYKLIFEVIVKLAEKPELTDLDLNKIELLLQEAVDKHGGGEKEAKISAASIYAKIAKAVSERKRSEMPGVLSDGKIKPPKKGIYRTRRAVNG